MDCLTSFSSTQLKLSAVLEKKLRELDVHLFGTPGGILARGGELTGGGRGTSQGMMQA